MLDQLARLSRDPSAEGRRSLLSAVTDLFRVEEQPFELLQDHYSAIATDALDRIGPDDRSSYAKRVAASATLPRTIATKLARDPEAAVASVLLALSPVLTDADLASIAVTHSPQHLLAIAGRSSLSANVTDVLVDRGDGAVLRKVSGNAGAELSESGMAGLIRHAETNPEVLEHLLRRKQNAQDHADRLQRIANELMPAVTVDNAVPFTPERRQAQARKLELRVLVAEVRSGARQTDDVVRLLASEDRAFDLAQLIGAVSGIPDAQVLKALLEFDVSGIAVACRSVGLSESAFQALLSLRRTRLRQSETQVERDLEAFRDLPNDVSERAMRFLQVRLRTA
jgi:uncharacterized protein (DUF2336 family)